MVGLQDTLCKAAPAFPVRQPIRKAPVADEIRATGEVGAQGPGVQARLARSEITAPIMRRGSDTFPFGRAGLREQHRMPDVIRLILDDHESFRARFAELEQLRDDPTAAAAVWAPLAADLEVHASAEEQFFYPQLLRRDHLHI